MSSKDRVELPRRSLFTVIGAERTAGVKSVTVEQVIADMDGAVERGGKLIVSREISKNISEKSGKKSVERAVEELVAPVVGVKKRGPPKGVGGRPKKPDGEVSARTLARRRKVGGP